MPKNEAGNCSIVKQFSSMSVDDRHPASDVSFTNTTIAFNIEENRRRRAELANDVSELINISKFFQQSYANGYDVDETSNFSLVRKSLTKKNKIPANGKSMATKSSKSSSCVAANAGRIAGQVSHTKLNNVAGVFGINNINNAVVTQVEQLHQNSALPPVFDPHKLNEYCFDIVEEYFKKSKSSDASDRNIKSKPKLAECVQQSTANEPKVGPATQQTKNESNKYASVSARYLNKCPNRKVDEQPVKTVRNSWISARSIAILENANRNGVEVKKHNCVAQETKNARTLGSAKKKVQKQCNRPAESFRRVYPDIDLIPSATIFPRRAVKLRDDDPGELATGRELNDLCDPTDDLEEIKSPQNLNVDVQTQPEVAALAPDATELNNRVQSASELVERMARNDIE